MITFWRSGVSIPEPLACKASALPFKLHPHSFELSRKLLFQSANKRLFFSLSQQLWSFSFRSQKIYLLGVSICNRLSALWRSGASNPVPLACKASTLPFELHPHSFELSRKLLFQSANKRLLIFRSQKIYLLGVPICNRELHFGDPGHQSPYLSHAKRALYHLSYIPIV